MRLERWKGGARDEFNAQLYPSQHPNVERFIRKQFEGINLDDPINSYRRDAYEAFCSYNDDDAIDFTRRIKLASSQDEATKIFDNNVITVITDADQMSSANVTMQRYIMANPIIRKKWLNNLCDGWSDTYMPDDRYAIEDTHLDYQRVTDGICIVKEDGWEITHHYHILPEGEKELTIGEKLDIMFAWKIAEEIMALNDVDPTSIYGEKLS